MTGHENIPVLQADFRTAVIQAVIAAGDNPKDPETEKGIEELEKYYATYLEQNRIYISGMNNIPGFRQIVFLGPEFFSGHNKGILLLGMIAITSDFRLVTGVFCPPDRMREKEKKAVTPEQAIESLVTPDKSVLKFVDNHHINFKFNLRDPDSHDPGSSHNPDSHDDKSCSIKSTKNEHMLNSFNVYIDLSSFKFDIREKISHFVVQQNRNRLALVRHAITDALDENTLHFMRDNNFIEMSKLRWITGGDGMARQQAVQSYPLMAELFQKYDFFHQVIDTRTSLSKAIADTFRVDQGRVKRLSGLTWQQIGSRPKHEVEILENMISNFLYLPDNGFPETVRQFEDLDILEEFGRNIYREDLPDFVGRLLKNGNPWRFMDKMRQTSGSNIADSIDFLSRKLIVPVMIKKSKYRICGDPEEFGIFMYDAKENILTDFKIGELLEWDKRYHRNIARYEDRLDFISVNREWPGMFGTIDLGNGCIARELTSTVKLKAQGRTESHCVGGYVSRVLDSMEHSEGRATMIFSLEQNDRILSTVEIGCSREYFAFDECSQTKQDLLCAHVEQNLAYHNADPCPMAENLAEQVVARVQRAGLETFLTYVDGLYEVCAKQNQNPNLEGYIVECGLDPHNDVHLEAAWEELGKALPQRLRENGLDISGRQGLFRDPCPMPSSEIEPSGIQFDGSDVYNYTEGPQDIHLEGQKGMHSEGIPEHDGP